MIPSPKTHPANTTPPEPDRFAHAKIFANELTESRIRKIKVSYEKRWTAARRAEQSHKIQIVKPWTAATGPKTIEGKARSSCNAGNSDAVTKLAKKTLAEQRRFLKALSHIDRLKKANAPGADILMDECLRNGRNVTFRLLLVVIALALEPVCNNAQ